MADAELANGSISMVFILWQDTEICDVLVYRGVLMIGRAQDVIGAKLVVHTSGQTKQLYTAHPDPCLRAGESRPSRERRPRPGPRHYSMSGTKADQPRTAPACTRSECRNHAARPSRDWARPASPRRPHACARADPARHRRRAAILLARADALRDVPCLQLLARSVGAQDGADERLEGLLEDVCEAVFAREEGAVRKPVVCGVVLGVVAARRRYERVMEERSKSDSWAHRFPSNSAYSSSLHATAASFT